MFGSRYLPCPECGAAVDQTDPSMHACDPERVLDTEVSRLREEIAAFDDQLTAYFDTPRGRFERWYAERERDAD
jgi:hypothetical protein